MLRTGFRFSRLCSAMGFQAGFNMPPRIVGPLRAMLLSAHCRTVTQPDERPQERRVRRPMKFAILLIGVLGARVAFAQNAAAQQPVMADDVFKNVQVLKGLTVSQFMETMGFISASLGYNCSD